MERLLFNGMPASSGKCKGCGLIVIVTDKDSEGTYHTFHQDPMCNWYIERCNNMNATQIESKVYEGFESQDNVLRVNSTKIEA